MSRQQSTGLLRSVVPGNSQNEQPSSHPLNGKESARTDFKFCDIGEHYVPIEYFGLELHEHICLICLRNKSQCPVCKIKFSQPTLDYIKTVVQLIINDPAE